MQRSGIRDVPRTTIPDFALLHPGYLLSSAFIGVMSLTFFAANIRTGLRRSHQHNVKLLLRVRRLHLQQDGLLDEILQHGEPLCLLIEKAVDD